MVKITKTFYAPTRAAWRKWLEKNHAREGEIWLIFPKKGSGRPRVDYEDAVEEAICFGWIDGLVKSIDETQYAQRFSPRKTKSNWTELNFRRFQKMVDAGLMTEAGMAKRPVAPAPKIDETLPKELQKFDITPGRQKLVARFINSAKREETRKRRIKEALKHLKKGDLAEWLKIG
jgi:uncharacterized protein YdeI (YjbR/CyaY-like superfamily)